MHLERLPAGVNRWSLVATPLLFALSGLVVPALKNGDVAQLAMISAHPDAWYAFTILSMVGSALLVPAALALMRATGAASAASVLGAGLLCVGGLVAFADSATQLVYWQMGARSADPAQMAALLHRYENAAGASLIFAVGALALVVGTVLLAIALVRTRVAPIWAAVLIPVGMVANIGSFVGSSKVLLVASSVVLLAGMGRIALKSRPFSRVPEPSVSV
jgi:hypothetical protein